MLRSPDLLALDTWTLGTAESGRSCRNRQLGDTREAGRAARAGRRARVAVICTLTSIRQNAAGFLRPHRPHRLGPRTAGPVHGRSCWRDHRNRRGLRPRPPPPSPVPSARGSWKSADQPRWRTIRTVWTVAPASSGCLEIVLVRERCWPSLLPSLERARDRARTHPVEWLTSPDYLRVIAGHPLPSRGYLRGNRRLSPPIQVNRHAICRDRAPLCRARRSTEAP